MPMIQPASEAPTMVSAGRMAWETASWMNAQLRPIVVLNVS